MQKLEICLEPAGPVAAGLSPDEKQFCCSSPLFLRKSKWLNVGWHGRGLVSTLK